MLTALTTLFSLAAADYITVTECPTVEIEDAENYITPTI